MILLRLYNYREAVTIYTEFLRDARLYGSKPNVFLRRTEDGLEFVGEADKGTSRHAFGFDKVFISESDGDRLKREYFVKQL